jgi:hypothetical protein
VAHQIEAGRVVINGAPHDPDVPFGGFKQSGIGREYGVFGLQSYLEPKALLGAVSALAGTALRATASSPNSEEKPGRRKCRR